MGVESYLLPRVDDPADAADALAETFLVAWRHLEEVPCGVDARPWLLAVARVPVSAASTSPDPGPHRVSAELTAPGAAQSARLCLGDGGRTPAKSE